MKLLIDSHVLIWMLYEPERIGKESGQLLEAADVVYVSAVSLWELTIKHLSGKLAYAPQDLIDGIAALQLAEMPLQLQHTVRLDTVDMPLKDPFDRLLLAQASAEGCSFLTADHLMLASSTAVRAQNVLE